MGRLFILPSSGAHPSLHQRCPTLHHPIDEFTSQSLRQAVSQLPANPGEIKRFINQIHQARHAHIGVAAWIDALEGSQIGIDIERYAVVTGTPPDTQPQRSNLGLADIDARRIGSRPCLDAIVGEQVNHGLLDGRNQLTYAEPLTPHIEQRVEHHLPRPMISHLPPAIGLNHGDITRHQQVFGFARLPLGEDRLMFH